MKRSSKFYNKNEKEVMERLGLKPTKASGAGWIEKEDGYNEYLLAQLKSTDAESIKVSLHDVHTLEYNAIIAHKIPVFMVQFLQSNELFVMVRPADLPSVAKYLQTGSYDIIDKSKTEVLWIDESSEMNTEIEKKVIKSSLKGREKFHKEREERFKCRK